MIKSKRSKIGDWLVVIVCFFVILLCLLPMINLLAQSLSSSDAVIHGKVSFLPVIHTVLRPEGAEQESDENSLTDSNTGSWFSSFESELNFDLNDDWFSNWSINQDTTDSYNYDSDFDWESLDEYYFDYDWEYDYDFASPIQSAETLSFKVGVTMESYRYVFLDPAFTRSMWWTALLTIICTIVSLTITILCAYPLTYDWLKGKTIINTIIIFTMYFSAGTIPNYILMKSLGLLNNPLVLIIPNCLSVFYMIILRSFFYGIPDSLRESAEIDGANPFTVLIRIYLPLSAPVLATLALFYAVGRWNGFTDALLYINAAPQWVPIQLKLWQLIQNMTSIDVSTVEMVSGNIPRASDAIKAAAIMFATIPILAVYPWLQRYFITGVTIGAVKG